MKHEKTIPKHIVLIPDGNRRWAKRNVLTAWQGHEAGFTKVQELFATARELGVTYFTLWGFSTENWKRDAKEVKELMKIFMRAIADIAEDAHTEQIKFVHLGRKDRLPADLVTAIEQLEQATAAYTKYCIALALDYGGRDELLRGISKLQENNIQITEENLSQCLDTKDMPDPDLIIRTSGEQRLSGILPWQGVYSELYFTPLMFPEFNSTALKEAVEDYSNRKRRFGK